MADKALQEIFKWNMNKYTNQKQISPFKRKVIEAIVTFVCAD